MYKLRKVFPNNKELSRQKKIQRIIFGARPFTKLDKLAAAVLNNSYINSTRAFKIEKRGEQILELLNNDDLTDQYTIQKKRNDILQIINSTKFEKGNIFQLSHKNKIKTLYFEPTPPIHIKWTIAQKTYVSLAEFERIMFDNNVFIRYYENVKFIDYIVENLKHYLNIQSIDEIADNLIWQARLLQFIDATDYNEYTLIKSFYENKIMYNNIIYDTKFIPKYPVLELKHQILPTTKFNNDKEINYWNSINLSSIDKIPLEYLSIFMVFPFKDGFYIQPNGTIIKIPLKPIKRKSLIVTIDSVCSLDDLEAVLDQTSQLYKVDEILNWTVYGKTLKHVGLGILLLRRYYGNILTISSYKIALPNEYNVLSWLALQCTNAETSLGVLLPLSGYSTIKNHTADITVNLIRDIIKTCQTAFGAAILCSNYCILESDMYLVYQQLNTPTEKYIFLILVFQYYPYYTYHKAIKSIKGELEFGNDTSINVLDLYKPSVRNYKNIPIEEKLQSLSIPMVRKQDLTSTVNTCDPTKCPELYEFVNPQLNELARTGTIKFQTPKEFANYIDLCI